MEIGTYLKKQREKAGLTIREVVEMATDELDKTTVSRIENNERKLSFKGACYLSKIYGVPLDELAKKAFGTITVKKQRSAKK